MQEKKPWYMSEGITGAILAFIGALVALISDLAGLNIDVYAALTGMLGAVRAARGRLNASTLIEGGTPKENKPPPAR